MPKRRIPFITNCHYHTFNRGVAKEPIFRDSEDYDRFLFFMTDKERDSTNPRQEKEVNIECYCLMPNHFHLLIKQCVDGGMVRYFQRFLTAYSMYFNRKYKRVGPLYQGRVSAKWIKDEFYFKEASRYIHRNPLELYTHAHDFLGYPYSSLKYYLTDVQAKSSTLLSFFDSDPRSYQRFVLSSQS